MERFGEFTVLEELGRSLYCDRYKAMHDSLGGPFFVKRYTRCPEELLQALHNRCERLMGINVPFLTPHLGHGETDDIPFVVSPFIEGVDLSTFIVCWTKQRTTLPSEALVYTVQMMARAIESLRAVEERDEGPRFTHGEICTQHIRFDHDGKMWLTGLTTPRILVPNAEPAPIWDMAGAAAAAFDLWPLTRKGQAGVPPSPALEEILRDFLGIDPTKHDRSAAEMISRLDAMVDASRLKPMSDDDYVEWIKRAARAYEKQNSQQNHLFSDGAADALPSLEPIATSSSAAKPASASTVTVETNEGRIGARTNVPREISLVTAKPQAAKPVAVPEYVAASASGVTPLELEDDRAMVHIVEAGLIDPADLEPARIQAGRREESLLTYLLKSKRVDALAAAEILAKASGQKTLSREALFEQLPRPELCKRVPRSYVKQRKMLPLQVHDGVLKLAVVDPFHKEHIREMQRHLRAASVQLCVVAFNDLAQAISTTYVPERLREGAVAISHTVLLCAQDEIWADKFGEALASEGFHIEHAQAFPQAFALCKAVSAEAMIIADDKIHPQMEELITTLQQNDTDRILPIYVITAETNGDKGARLLDKGVADCLHKPANVGLLAAKLRRTLSDVRSTANPSSTGEERSGDPKVGKEPGGLLTPAVLPTGVLGTLAQMPLTEVIQNLENGKKNAVVDLQFPEQPRGILGFEGGQILYAQCGEEVGQEAFFQMVGFESGVFRIRYGKELPARNIDVPTMFLLLEAMRLLDERLPELEDSEVEELAEDTKPFSADLEQ